MTLSIATLRIMIHSIKGLYATLYINDGINDTQHNGILYQMALC